MNRKKDVIDAVASLINAMDIVFPTRHSESIIFTPAQSLAREFMILKENDASELELIVWRKGVREKYGNLSSHYLEDARLIAMGELIT